MDEIFDENAADKEIIGTLVQTNQILWRELETARGMLRLQQQAKRRDTVKILQDLNGAYYLAKEYIELTEETAEEILAHAEHDLAMVRRFLGREIAAIENAASAPAEQVQTQDNAPADQTQNAPSDQGQPAPSDVNAQVADPSQSVAAPAAPADPNQPPADPNAQPVPVAPALDANGNVVQADPAQDPNQAQPQPEQPVMPPLQ